MTDESPKHLVDSEGVDAELQSLLRDAGSARMPRERKQIVATALGAATGVTLVAATAEAASSGGVIAAFFASTAAKIGAAVMIVGASASVASWAVHSRAPEQHRKSSVNMARSAPSTETAVHEDHPVIDAPRAVPATPEILPALPQTETRHHAATPHELATPAPVEQEMVEVHHEQVAPPPAPPGELQLLADAQRLLATDPTAALAITETHRHDFARGELAEEREVIAIDALMRLHRESEARSRAADFLDRYDGSGHARRVRHLIGAQTAEPGTVAP